MKYISILIQKSIRLIYFNKIDLGHKLYFSYLE